MDAVIHRSHKVYPIIYAEPFRRRRRIFYPPLMGHQHATHAARADRTLGRSSDQQPCQSAAGCGRESMYRRRLGSVHDVGHTPGGLRCRAGRWALALVPARLPPTAQLGDQPGPAWEVSRELVAIRLWRRGHGPGREGCTGSRSRGSASAGLVRRARRHFEAGLRLAWDDVRVSQRRKANQILPGLLRHALHRPQIGHQWFDARGERRGVAQRPRPTS